MPNRDRIPDGPAVTVYVLFHEDSDQAKQLARRTFRWLRFLDRDADSTAVGLPVYFRVIPRDASAAPGTKGGLRERVEQLLRCTDAPMPLDTGHLFIVPLVDDHMVMDDGWRAALDDLARLSAHRRDGLARVRPSDAPAPKERTGTAWSERHDAPVLAVPSGDPETSAWRFVSVLPVMVDRSFNALGPFSDEHNPLRIWSPDDDAPGRAPTPPDEVEGLDVASVLSRTAEYEARKAAHDQRRTAWLEVRARRLRQTLTEAMVRDLDDAAWMRDGAEPSDRPGRLKVFISHAKADGEPIAQRIRDGLASVSKLEPWFDKNDLRAGKRWADPMEAAAAGSSGGFIAVVTDRYATRPWCWREARAARTVRPVADAPGIFTMQPAVAVHVARSGWSRLPPALAGVPRLGWPAEPPTPDRNGSHGLEGAGYRQRDQWEDEAQARVADIVDRLLLELLIQRTTLLHARRLQRLSRTAGSRTHWYMDFVPDARNLPQLLPPPAESGEPATAWARPDDDTVLVYPGYGLRSAERQEAGDALHRLAPSMTLRSLEEEQVSQARDPEAEAEALPRADQRPLIAISAGGPDQTLMRKGLSEGHLEDFAIRLTRLLLQTGNRVAYGGSLHPQGAQSNFTMAVFDAAQGWMDGSPGEWGFSDERSGASADGSGAGADPIAHPPVVNYTALPYAGALTTAVRARHAGLAGFVIVPHHDGDKGGKADLCAHALTAMRETMAVDCAGRIVFGGKVTLSSGWLPGIAEELLTSLDHHPVLLFAELGGCGEEVAKTLIPERAWKEGEEKTHPLGFPTELAARRAAWGSVDGRPRPDRARQQGRYERMLAQLQRLAKPAGTPRADTVVLSAGQHPLTISFARDTTHMLGQARDWVKELTAPRS